MTNLTESSVFESGVYQLETDDPVLGGVPAFDAGMPVTGHANAQAQQLANRTKWLYDNKASLTDLDNTSDTLKGSSLVGFNQHVTGSVGRTVKDKLKEFVSIKDFGAVGDGITDDTTAIQSALNASNKVYVPSGTYRSSILYLNSNQEFFGDGAASILQAVSEADYNIVATYAFSGGTSNPADNKKNIYVHDLKIDQRKRDFGHNGFKHAMTINATSDMVVERVVFYDFRGDGCYVGSGTSGGIDRKNINIAFRDCIFDGRVKDVRNGLSIIDCDGLIVDSCTFRNIGAPVASQSVGAIDFEPNNPWNTYRNVRITNCTFDGVDNTNSAAVSFWNGNQVGNDQNIYNFVVSGNVFRKCYTGVGINSVAKNTGSPDDTLVISENHFLDSINLDIGLGGLKNTKIIGNTFELTTPGSSSYRGCIRVGLPTSGRALNAIGVLIFGNTFTGLRPQGGAVWINGVIDCKIDSNTFNDISGVCIDLYAPSTAGLNQCLNGISIRNNTVNNQLKYAASPVTTTYFIRQGAGINNGTTNNSFISSSCVEENNVLNDTVPRNAGGTTTVFSRETRSATPTTGSWEQGNIVFDSVPAAGAFAFACSVSGTFGTMSNAPTGSATNGSTLVSAVADPDTSLRTGQWVTLTGDATAKRIAAVEYGKAASITITNGGSGYLDGQSLVFSLSSAIRGTGIATVVAGAITAVTVIDGGVNFVTGDVVNIESTTPASGSGAAGTVTAQTNLYLSGSFTGTTGAVTFTWSAPTFVVG